MKNLIKIISIPKKKLWGVAKLVKAPDFDSGMRGFESFLPSHILRAYCEK